MTTSSPDLMTMSGTGMYSHDWNQSSLYPDQRATSNSSARLTAVRETVPVHDETDLLEQLAEQYDAGDLGETHLKETLIVVAYSIVVLVSLIGNLFVVLVIISKKRTRTTVNIFIANLAVSDLLMTVLNIPFTTARMLMSNWIFGSFLCHVSPFIQATSVYVSTLTMCFIAVDRFRAILQPLRRRIVSKVVSLFAIAAIWAIAMLFSLPFLFFNRMSEHRAFGKTYVRCRVVYPEPEYLYKKSVNIITFILQFGIPFTIMVSLYTRIGIKIWSRTTIGATTREQENRQFMAKKRTIIMLLLVAIVFAICWLPHNLYHFLVDFKYWNEDYYLLVGVHWLAMSSVCYNPFIYFWLNRRFQQILRAGMLRFCGNCYCLPNSSGCSCMGITCFCHKMTAAKMGHVSSPTSGSSPPRAVGTAAHGAGRSNQAYRMHHSNRNESRKELRKQKESDEERDTSFNNPHPLVQETVSEYTQDITNSPHTRENRRNPESCEYSGESETSPEASGQVMNNNSVSSTDSHNKRKNTRTRTMSSPEKGLKTVSSYERKTLLRSRNHHSREAVSGIRSPMVWNHQKWNNNLTGRMFLDPSSSTKHSLSSSSSAGSGLNHQNHLICHYSGSRRPVHGNHHPLYQTQCNHDRLERKRKTCSEHNIVLTSI